MAKPLTPAQTDAIHYMYGGGEETIECWSARWVVTRFSQSCWAAYHKGKHALPAGTRMIVERAKIDGQFASCYTCQDCILAAQKELR